MFVSFDGLNLGLLPNQDIRYSKVSRKIFSSSFVKSSKTDKALIK